MQLLILAAVFFGLVFPYLLVAAMAWFKLRDALW